MLTATVRDSSGNLAPDGTTVQFSTDGGTLAQDTATTHGRHRPRPPDQRLHRLRRRCHRHRLRRQRGRRDRRGQGGVHVRPRPALHPARRPLDPGGVPPVPDLQRRRPRHRGAGPPGFRPPALQGALHRRGRPAARPAVADPARQERRRAARPLTRCAPPACATTWRAATAPPSPPSAARPPAPSPWTAPTLETSPMLDGGADYYTANDVYQFADLSASRLIVTARAISVDPGKTLQFRRAAIYADGKKVVSMAYQVMPMDSNQLFGRQLVGFNSTGGLALDVPFYYHVDPHSTGTLFLRNCVVGSNDGSAGPLDATRHAARPRAGPGTHLRARRGRHRAVPAVRPDPLRLGRALGPHAAPGRVHAHLLLRGLPGAPHPVRLVQPEPPVQRLLAQHDRQRQPRPRPERLLVVQHQPQHLHGGQPAPAGADRHQHGAQPSASRPASTSRTRRGCPARSSRSPRGPWTCACSPRRCTRTPRPT